MQLSAARACRVVPLSYFATAKPINLQVHLARQRPQETNRVGINRPTDREKLHDIDAPFVVFGNERLRPFQALSDLMLREAGLFGAPQSSTRRRRSAPVSACLCRVRESPSARQGDLTSSRTTAMVLFQDSRVSDQHARL